MSTSTLLFRSGIASMGALALALLAGAAGCGGQVTVEKPNEGGGGGEPQTGGGGASGCASAEICGNGVDDNCDGQIDEGCDGCQDGQQTSCYTGPFGTAGIGICKLGIQTCSGGSWGPCAGEVVPSPELCNGIDDDCNGAVDELPNIACGEGACFNSVPACVNGVPQICAPGAPTLEVCDGVDNDCNGLVDDGNASGAMCGCGGVTVCNPDGSLSCIGGNPIFFYEDFSDNSAGWILGDTWQIAFAPGSPPPPVGSPDPAVDHSPSADNGIAGAVLGGTGTLPVGPNFPASYYLTSPTIDLSMAPAGVFLQFWRWLNTDYPPFMDQMIEVSSDDGMTWTKIWSVNQSTLITDTAWYNADGTHFDVTAWKSPAFRVRFGWSLLASGAFTVTGWNIDDITIAGALCL